ncbi:MAG TPA: redoxin family protein [Candidatus Acidoferrum sp.]|nr:redoxin family protein [Candidatus Acidoferrum sp.]
MALSDAGNDRASLVRNLEDYLKKYPASPQRSQIYRALVEASLQLKDSARAADYAERIVSLNPEDVSITILAIQLLEQQGDEAGLRRAVSYSGRVLTMVEGTSPSEKSPRISTEEWAQQKKRDRMSVLALRGRLELKLKDTSAAQQDFTASYAILPSANAAEQLGEIAELNKDLNTAIQQYARAFALSESVNGNTGRRDIRRKLGNVWRLAHGSENGLGEYLLQTFDDVAKSAAPAAVRRNAGIHEFSDFVLRKALDGTPYPLKDTKGKVVVVNFWATWCGPCHALEPLFARVAAEFQATAGALFLSVNCDEDETLVGPYLQKAKPHTEVVYADGLDRLFSVDSFPTVIVVGRDGKIAFRSNGFEPDTFEHDLSAAVQRALPNPPPAQ